MNRIRRAMKLIGHIVETGGRRDVGQALVEFTVAAPVVFLVLLGLFDVGRLVFINNEIAQAAREGARWGAVQGRAADEAAGDSTAVSDEVSAHIVVAPAPQITLSCTDLRAGGASCASGDLLSIEVRSSVNPITPLIGDIFGPMVLESEAQMAIH
jgi:Flp pilus assembly protein TadG